VTAGVIILIVVVVLVLAVLGWAITSYNGLIRLRNLVQESWRQIDVELKRRHDLIPNLVETVKGYASHERETLDAVIRARAAAVAPGSSVGQQAAQEGILSAALGKLFAVAEAYPNLKANENFLALQSELTDTEDRIAAGRRFYNANVRQLNTAVESVPSNIVAGLAHIGRADYFEVEDAAERQAPQVSFGSSGPGSGSGTVGAGSAPPAVQGGSAASGPGAVGSGEYTVPGSTPTYGTPPTNPS
jgi:LemA protein